MEDNPVAGKPMSYRHADRKTGVNYATIGAMTMGQVPEMESVVRFAQGFGLNVNEWLSLADYDPIWDPDAAITAGLRLIAADYGEVRVDTRDLELAEATPAAVDAALAAIRARACPREGACP